MSVPTFAKRRPADDWSPTRATTTAFPRATAPGIPGQRADSSEPSTAAGGAPEKRQKPWTRWFNNLGIRVKILAVIGTMTAVVVTTLLVATISLNSTGNDMHGIVDQQRELVAPLQDVRAGQSNERSLLLRTLVLSDPAAIAKIEDQISVAGTELDKTIATIDADMSTIASEPWTEFKTSWAEFEKLRDEQLMSLAASNRDSEFTALYETKVAPLADKLDESMAMALDHVVASFRETADASEAQNASSVTTMILVALLGLVAAVALGLYIAGAIRRPLIKVQHALAAMAQRDLTVGTNIHSTDEVGKMADALRITRENIRDVVAGLSANAESVASSSEELSAASEQVAAGAEETSAQAGVVAAASEQVSRNVQTVAAGSEQMDASIREIAQNATEASKVASTAMIVANETTTTVTQLGESSKAIGDVVKAITSIAAQTNLLALNATIEAARAGEAGKGFAVVANEVKELAQETSSATEDIVRRVDAIQADSASAAAAIERITEVIASINDFQASIASAVEEQTATTAEMARNVSEAAAGTGEIAANITGVATAAASTTEALSQSRAAIDELARLATDLEASIRTFKV